MGLKAILETIDDLSEETRSLYSEQKVGEKTVFVLNVEDIDNHPKVRGVITANNENKRNDPDHFSFAVALLGVETRTPAS